mgnify:CR=1 FL=1
MCFNTLYVVGSNFKKHIQTLKIFRFNTLYVVGSMLGSKYANLDITFQYIICCWFKLSECQQYKV